MKVPYAIRWGHPRYRTLKGHPKRKARIARAKQREEKRNVQVS